MIAQSPLSATPPDPPRIPGGGTPLGGPKHNLKMSKKCEIWSVCSRQNRSYIAHVPLEGCKFVEKVPRGALFSLFLRVSPPIRIFFCAK